MTLEPPHPEDPAEQPLLQADGLGIRMAERWLFRNLGFSLSRGDFLAVVGPSGSGKTTLLRSLTGELKSDEGSVRNLAQGLLPGGTIFQDLQLANGARAIQNALSGSLGRHGTLETLFGFPASEKSSSMELLERLGLADKGDQWTSTLSRGERQRLAIARTL
ncbi:MAG: ATP-binding cassette domain-containing protein, partial [Verrucomicrobiota bacterium]|nr:ATP-binding cassette domain-containing protein [Verrucomicrobiota bacterium]